jgi:hypothetical protein
MACYRDSFTFLLWMRQVFEYDLRFLDLRWSEKKDTFFCPSRSFLLQMQVRPGVIKLWMNCSSLVRYSFLIRNLARLTVRCYKINCVYKKDVFINKLPVVLSSYQARLAKSLSLMTHTLEIPASNLKRETGMSLLSFFVFSSSPSRQIPVITNQ